MKLTEMDSISAHKVQTAKHASTTIALKTIRVECLNELDHQHQPPSSRGVDEYNLHKKGIWPSAVLTVSKKTVTINILFVQISTHIQN